MLAELSARIWKRKAFREDFSALLMHDLATDLGLESPSVNSSRIASDRVLRLAKSASIFSQAGNAEQRDAAYRIAVSLLRDKPPSFNSIALHILEKLGNFPAIDFGFRAGLPIEGQDLRAASLLLHHFDENQVSISQRTLTLTNFQKRLWRYLIEARNVVVSAPTSAGKSFVVQHYLVDALLKGHATQICYIVPSRALINQVSMDLKRLLHDLTPEFQYQLITAPSPTTNQTEPPVPTIAVLTQERLHLLLDSDEAIPFDILAVDEAQSIGDGGRGVLLYSAITRVKKTSPDVQLLFVCPFADIEQSFPAMFPDLNLAVVQEYDGAVAQNLIRVDLCGEPTNEIRLFLLEGGQEIDLGTTTTELELLGNNHVATIAKKLSSGASNLIYAGGPARCEDIARMLADLEGSQPSRSSDDAEALSEFVKRAVHPKFLLAESVQCGVGYHYGRLPSLVRREIERAFSTGAINYLVTTSTLLHGVNLPARNLFIDKPIKGSDDLLTGPEFWNLVGRAGRLGKEFEGNIFLINLKEWEKDLTTSKKQYEVTSALGRQILEHSDELSKFIADFDVASGDRQDIENAAAKLYIDYVSGDIDKTLADLGATLPSKQRERLIESLAQVKAKVNLETTTIQRNQTISVAIQQRLKDYLIQNISTNGPERVMPLHPLSESKKLHSNYLAIFKRIHNHIEKKPKADRSHTFFAPLAIRWMRGDPLPKLIDQAIKYREKNANGREVNIPLTIRETLKTVENDLRFRYVKYMSCYTSILAEALRETGHGDKIYSIPNLSLYMEMGASSPSMLSLIQIGVSRITAALVVSQMVHKSMDAAAMRRWLQSIDLASLDLPGASIRELKLLQY